MATKAMKGKYIRIRMWNGKYKYACGVTTINSKDKKQVEIKNFLGGKKGHLINLAPGCTI